MTLLDLVSDLADSFINLAPEEIHLR